MPIRRQQKQPPDAFCPVAAHSFYLFLLRFQIRGICVVNNPLDLFAWKVRSERKRQHLTQKQLAERLGMNPRTIIDLETGKSNPKFETVVLVAKELNISVDAAIFPEMVNQTVSKTVVDFFAGKSEAEIEKFIALCKQAEAFQKDE